MISEVDINDWRDDMITTEQAKEALEDMDDYARMDVGVIPTGPYEVLKEFISQYHDLMKVKTLPYILRPKKGD